MKKLIALISLILLSHTAIANRIIDSLSDPQLKGEQAPTAQPTTTDSSTLWSEANQAYIDKDYTKALELYNAICKEGLLSSKLYYNMGNAYYKNGEIGKAILFYKRAHKLAPADEDIRYNLDIAEAQTKDNIEKVPDFFLKRWSRSIAAIMDSNSWTYLSIAAFVLMLTSVLVFLLAQSIKARKSSFAVALLSLVIAVISLIYASSQRSYMLSHDKAVIMSESVSIKNEPNKSSTDQFVLHEGTTVHVTESLGQWCNITTADGNKGWIEQKRIEVI